MTTASPDILLEKLVSGDITAAEQAFLAYEPLLHMMVRRQLSPRVRVKFDSVDVLQSVWARLLQYFRQGSYHFDNAPQLRAFLIKVTRNLFLNRLRRHHQALKREQPLAGHDGEQTLPSSQPRPSEIVQARDLWVRMLALCPPEHRKLLQLKKQGFSLAEIAATTGLHPSSVRRLLYELARRLAFQENRQDLPVTSDESL